MITLRDDEADRRMADIHRRFIEAYRKRFRFEFRFSDCVVIGASSARLHTVTA